MPRNFRLLDSKTGRVIVRHGRDAREILGQDPERYSQVADGGKPLIPIVHSRSESDVEPVTVATFTPPASVASPPPPARAKKQPSQATNEKRAAALAKGRATAAANRAARAQAKATA